MTTTIRRRPLRIGIVLVLWTILLATLAGCGSSTDGRSETGSSQRRGPEVELTDVLGRKVTVNVPSARILVDGSRLLYTTAFLNKEDPVDRIVGWPKDLIDNDPGTYELYKKKFPEVGEVPFIGDLWDGSFSVEQAIKLKPDVFVISASAYDAAEDAGTLDQLEKVGIPVVAIDYFLDPIKNTVPSVEIMGKLMDREAEADKFVSYYRSAVDDVTARLEEADEPATPTFLWRAPGYFDCCESFAKSNLAQIVDFAGGENLADDILPGEQGSVSPETVLSKNPEVIIATGADWSPDTPAKPGTFVPLGYQAEQQKVDAQLRAVVDREPGFKELRAVKEHRTYAAWHHFYDSPYNFLAIQWFAKWMHPDVFADIDPTKGFDDMHQKFLPVEPAGTFAASLP